MPQDPLLNPSPHPSASAPSPKKLSLAELEAAVEFFSKDSKAKATRKAYRAAQASFTAFCEEMGFSALPATPKTVTLYLTAREAACMKPSTMASDLAAISAAHKDAGLPSPCRTEEVRACFSGIRRERGIAPTQKAPLLPADLAKLCAALPRSLLGKRDKALLLFGFATACRRAELCALTVSDVSFVDGKGAIVILKRSKTDQEGLTIKKAVPFALQPAVCPVLAMQDWLQEAAIIEGPLFRYINRHGKLGSEPLNGASIAKIIKRAAKKAGLDPKKVSGHSLRAGFVTAAAIAGKNELTIMRQTGHSSSEMVRRYVRDSDLWRSPAGEGLL